VYGIKPREGSIEFGKRMRRGGIALGAKVCRARRAQLGLVIPEGKLKGQE